MKYFLTSLSTIQQQSLADRPVFDSDEQMKEFIQYDLDRTQIADGQVYVNSDRDSQNQINKSEKRENFNKFFLDFFSDKKADLPYNQGMITGQLVDASLHKEFARDKEKVESFLQNNQDIKFCYQTEKGDWKGVYIKVNLETKEWFAVVTDFSKLPNEGHHVAIIGTGECFEILNKNLNQNQAQQEPMENIIDHQKLQHYFKYLETHLLRLDNMEKMNKEKFSPSELYKQCFHPLRTMGLSENIMNDREMKLKNKESQESIDIAKPPMPKASWNPFKRK